MKALLIAFTLFWVQAAAWGAPPCDEYELYWSDEFEGETLDSDKWGYRNLGPRRDGINVEETVRLDGEGRLVLTTKRVGDEFHTAMIGTQGKFETRFGYFECRVLFQREVGHWSAFWLQSPTINQVGDPRINGTEIDIFEYLANHPHTLHMNLHWDGYGERHKTTGRKHECESLTEGWRVIGLEWTPDEYRFYLDGEEVWRTDQAVSHREQYIILSLEVGAWAGDIYEANLPDSVLFDYIRVYKKP